MTMQSPKHCFGVPASMSTLLSGTGMIVNPLLHSMHWYICVILGSEVKIEKLLVQYGQLPLIQYSLVVFIVNAHNSNVKIKANTIFYGIAMDKRAAKCCRSVRRKTAWAMDFDYLQKLSSEEISFLAEFCNLHYHGSPHRTGQYIQPTPEHKKESYTRNNKAEFDLYNHDIRVDITIISIEPDFNIENYIIDFIDNKYI